MRAKCLFSSLVSCSVTCAAMGKSYLTLDRFSLEWFSGAIWCCLCETVSLECHVCGGSKDTVCVCMCWLRTEFSLMV